jgi:hypothetical protein
MNSNRKLFIRSAWILIFAILICVIFSKELYSFSRFARKAYYAAANGKEQFRYTGPVKATTRGKPALTLSIRSLTTENQIILFLGRLIVKGKITPTTAGSALPSTLQLIMKHKNPANVVIKTTTFNVAVQSSGVILQQSLPFTTFDLINPKETLELSVIPFDKNLPAGTISLTTTHLLGASVSSIPEDKEVDAPTASKQLVFVFNNFKSESLRNKVIGPAVLKAPGDPTFFGQGTLRVQGKITIDGGGNAGFPNTMRITLKHKKQQGNKLLKLETFNVKIEPDGRILNQSFPVSGKTDTETPDLFEASLKYVDKNMPDRVVNMTFAFTQPSTL